MNSVQQWFQFFERVSCFYKERMLLSWKKHSHYDTDLWNSLAIFLESYAFERQGRKPDYFHAAVDALLTYKKAQKGDLTRDDAAKRIWELFSDSLGNQNLNEQNNPLCLKGTEYKRKNKRAQTRQLSVIKVVHENNGIRHMSFTAYLRERIIQNDIQGAFDLLKSIQGVGDKIASFYLRDLASIMEINLSQVENRHLLQPVDVWVARTVIHLDRNEFSRLKQKIEDGGELSNKEKTSLAKWIVRKSEKNRVNPELVNMGIWYFCSKVATSEYRLNRVLENINDLTMANNLVGEHAMWIENAGRNCQTSPDTA